MTIEGRRSLILVQPIRLTGYPDWPTGPLPLQAGTTTASTPARSSYFTAPCARILYGSAAQPTRWHTFLGEQRGSTAGLDDAADPGADGAAARRRGEERGLFAAEVLVPDPATDPHAGLAIWHLAAHGDEQLELLRAAAGRHTDEKLPGLDEILRPFATIPDDTRPFTIAFMTQTGPRLSLPKGISRRLGWTTAQAWLWLLASRTSPTDYPPDPEHADRLLTGTVPLSADWRGLVARDGAAFVALRPDRGPNDPFLGHAQLYAHTTYLDALLLGMIQRANVERMVTDSAAAFDAPDVARHLERLEARAARFRTIYWLRDASSHGPANDILDAYQAQHGLPQRFEAVLTEIADLSRILQERQAQRTGAALGVLTIVGLPFGIALEVLQALAANTVTDLALGIAGATAATGALLTTRIGRVLLRQLRQLR